MYIPKRYGQSKSEPCPFCERQSLAINEQGVAVCLAHKDKLLTNLKCLCGDYIDIRTGKFGAFAVCINCGNINLKKILEVNRVS